MGSRETVARAAVRSSPRWARLAAVVDDGLEGDTCRR
jgi:hypothetical protein